MEIDCRLGLTALNIRLLPPSRELLNSWWNHLVSVVNNSFYVLRPTPTTPLDEECTQFASVNVLRPLGPTPSAPNKTNMTTGAKSFPKNFPSGATASEETLEL